MLTGRGPRGGLYGGGGGGVTISLRNQRWELALGRGQLGDGFVHARERLTLRAIGKLMRALWSHDRRTNPFLRIVWLDCARWSPRRELVSREHRRGRQGRVVLIGEDAERRRQQRVEALPKAHRIAGVAHGCSEICCSADLEMVELGAARGLPRVGKQRGTGSSASLAVTSTCGEARGHVGHLLKQETGAWHVVRSSKTQRFCKGGGAARQAVEVIPPGRWSGRG